MQFTKVFSIIALAATSVHALPEPRPVPVSPVGVTGNYSLVSDATSTVILGAQAYSAASVATINSLVAQVIASAKSDAAAAAGSIATIVGGGQVYADALANILTQLSACVAANA